MCLEQMRSCWPGIGMKRAAVRTVLHELELNSHHRVSLHGVDGLNTPYARHCEQDINAGCLANMAFLLSALTQT